MVAFVGCIRNGIGRTGFSTLGATDTCFRYFQFDHLFTSTRAANTLYMLFIFLAEVFQRGEDRVRCGLTQATECHLLDADRQLLQFVNVFHRTFTGTKPIEDVQHAANTDPAEGTLATRLLASEREEVAGDIHHTTALAQDDHTARAHNGSHAG